MFDLPCNWRFTSQTVTRRCLYLRNFASVTKIYRPIFITRRSASSKMFTTFQISRFIWLTFCGHFLRWATSRKLPQSATRDSQQAKKRRKRKTTRTSRRFFERFNSQRRSPIFRYFFQTERQPIAVATKSIGTIFQTVFYFLLLFSDINEICYSLFTWY